MERGTVDIHMCNDDTLSLLSGGVLYGQLSLDGAQGPVMHALPFVFRAGHVYLPWKPSLMRLGLPAAGQPMAFGIADIARMYQGNFSLVTVTCYGVARMVEWERAGEIYSVFNRKYEALAPFDVKKPLLSLASERIEGRIHAETMQGDFEEVPCHFSWD